MVDGPAARALLAQPTGMSLDREKGLLYFLDSESSAVRCLQLTGEPTPRPGVPAPRRARWSRLGQQRHPDRVRHQQSQAATARPGGADVANIEGQARPGVGGTLGRVVSVSDGPLRPE